MVPKVRIPLFVVKQQMSGLKIITKKKKHGTLRPFCHDCHKLIKGCRFILYFVLFWLISNIYTLQLAIPEVTSFLMLFCGSEPEEYLRRTTSSVHLTTLQEDQTSQKCQLPNYAVIIRERWPDIISHDSQLLLCKSRSWESWDILFILKLKWISVCWHTLGYML